MGKLVRKFRNHLLKIYDGKMEGRLEREFNNALDVALTFGNTPAEFAEFFVNYLANFGIMIDPKTVLAAEVKLVQNNELEVWLYTLAFDVKITKHNAEILPKTVYVEHD